MKKILLLSIIAVAALMQVQAQDQAIFSHYNINPILIHPAAAGFSGQHQLLFNARMQWTGFPDAPKTFMAQYNGPLSKSFGIGFGVLSESAAQLQRTRAQLNYAIRFPLGKDWEMAAGFSTELQQIRLHGDVAGGSFVDLGDRIIDANMSGVRFLDASVGIYGTYKENTFGGLSFTNLVRSRLDGLVVSDEKESLFNYYVFYLGHKFEVEDLKFTLEPSVMARQIRDVPFQLDINLKAGFLDDQLLAGVSYRSLGVMGVMLGVQVSPFNLYYTYDVSFQRFQQFNSGAHEVTIALNMKKKGKK
ncbi:MAG TPA: PorP/SprF family type IX secretion system membrane protein [Saprospiraceae bacterium]|nr:PorP/SprF family type IX secretion system membrane protein [Saprospiraceae bacterium]